MGADGHADTDRARSLEPHPADFHDPRISDPLSPLRVNGTVQFGLNGTAMVPCDQQLTAAYLGTSAKKGQFVDTLVSTADFLVKQDRLPKLLPRKDFENFIDPSYIEKAIAK